MDELFARISDQNTQMLRRCQEILFSIECMGVDTKKNEMYQAIYYIMGMTNEIKLKSNDRQKSEVVKQ